MIDTNNFTEKETYQDILLICPTCKAKKDLKIPTKIINQAKQLTTVSIPSGTVCDHSFQSFVDKNFKVRGYQTVDFEFSNLEFYESVSDEENEQDFSSTSLSSLPLFQDIIKFHNRWVRIVYM